MLKYRHKEMGGKMNLLHLKYVIEVAKAGSISKAASNLYMNQPHLSKTIKDLEENMQIIIFERTSKGVIPTKKGAEFIERAKSIIMQVDEMEAMYHGYDDKSVHLDICVPRASYVANAFTNYLSMINFRDKNISVNYRETNSFDTIKDKISLNDLVEQIEITHGDISLPALPLVSTNRNDETRQAKKEITIYERGIQFELLNCLPHTYMWVSPIPQNILDRYNLKTITCYDNKMNCYDLLIKRKGYRLSKEDQGLIKEVKRCLKENNI